MSRQSNQVMIPAGSLRHLVQIQQQSTTQDEFGGQIATWDTIRTPRAAITTDAAPQPREAFQSGQFSAQVTQVITIRYAATPVLRGGMRVVFTENSGAVHTYLIQTVENVKLRNIRIDLMCIEIDGSQ